MRVLILSQYYYPEPIIKPMELALALKAKGDEVTVVTGFPNYPAGKLYDGYKLRLLAREEIEGINVIRTFEFPYHGTRAIGRLVNYVSFMLSAPIGAMFARKVDVIYVWHPPLTVGVAAWLISLMRRTPFVYDVQDIWPEAAILAGILKPGTFVRALSRLERFVYKRADHLIVVTKGAKGNLMSKGVSPGKVTAMPHWFEPENFLNHASSGCLDIRLQYGWGNSFIALFAGNIGMVQGPETLIRAAEILKGNGDFKLIFIGDGVDKARLEKIAKKLCIEDAVQFIERQPLGKMPEFMAAADAMLVHLKWSELSDYVIPTKTLAYMASGKPIIMAMNGAAADIIKEAGAGLVVAPEDPVAIAEAIKALMSMSDERRKIMGKQGADFLCKNFARDVVIPQYRQLLADVAEKST